MTPFHSVVFSYEEQWNLIVVLAHNSLENLEIILPKQLFFLYSPTHLTVNLYQRIIQSLGKFHVLFHSVFKLYYSLCAVTGMKALETLSMAATYSV